MPGKESALSRVDRRCMAVADFRFAVLERAGERRLNLIAATYRGCGSRRLLAADTTRATTSRCPSKQPRRSMPRGRQRRDPLLFIIPLQPWAQPRFFLQSRRMSILLRETRASFLLSVGPACFRGNLRGKGQPRAFFRGYSGIDIIGRPEKRTARAQRQSNLRSFSARRYTHAVRGNYP